MNLRQKASGLWVVDYEDENGVRRRVSTGLRDKSAATKRAREIILGIDVRPADPGPRPGSAEARGTTLDQVFDLCCTQAGPWCAREAKSQGTIKSNLKVLRPLIGHELVSEVSYRRLEELKVALLARDYAPATVKRKLDMVGRALTYAMHMGIIAARPQMPSINTEASKRTRVLREDEEALIFQLVEARVTAEPARQWQRFGHLIRFLLDTGCRLGEALASETWWVETYRSRAVLHIPASATKTGKARQVPLSGAVVASLPFLRISSVGGKLFPMRAATAWYMFSNIKEEIEAKHQRDLGDVVLHTLRHTCVTRMLQRGVPLVQVSKWVGHANVKITASVYGHLEVDDLMSALDLMEALPDSPPVLSAVSG